MKLCTDNFCVQRLLFCEKSRPSLCGSWLEKRVKHQLDAYFEGEWLELDFSLKLLGSVFQVKAWQVLQTIPYGQTISYQQQLELMGYRKGAQAIGQANKNNPIQIIIPCHRVICSNGALGGYEGGIDRKIWLLSHEKYV